ncbi:restriction endonuclease [Pseudoxanthomonas broegbernensis]|uniref:Restriction endonuclease n=2 Tax=Pseudoxanthomonas broegbernensis TaxID=83619 RepID=A0A7V8K7Q5_9GAMM|nr:restriction endonuclease [Pseudoxanthomonas broegbernensis]
MIDWLELRCPYCGEPIDVAVDAGAGDQQYVEDCQVCCRPMVMTVSVEQPEGPARVVAQREDEA